MTYVWKVSKNIEYTEMNLLNGKKVLLVFDNIAKKFFISLNNLYASVGHRENLSHKTVTSDVYNRCYKPFHFSIFEKHVFIQFSDIASFVTRFMSISGGKKIRQDAMKNHASYILKNIGEAYKSGEKLNNKKTILDNDILVYNNVDIQIAYVKGEMLLQVKDMLASLGFNRRSGLSDVYTEMSQTYDLKNGKARYVKVKDIPALATRAMNKDGLMLIYKKACSFSKYGAMSSRKQKPVVIDVEKRVAFINYEHPVRLDVIDDEVYYQVLGLSRSIGLQDSSVALCRYGVELDDSYFVSKENISEFLENTVMRNDIRVKWNRVVRNLY